MGLPTFLNPALTTTRNIRTLFDKRHETRFFVRLAEETSHRRRAGGAVFFARSVDVERVRVRPSGRRVQAAHDRREFTGGNKQYVRARRRKPENKKTVHDVIMMTTYVRENRSTLRCNNVRVRVTRHTCLLMQIDAISGTCKYRVDLFSSPYILKHAATTTPRP